MGRKPLRWSAQSSAGARRSMRQPPRRDPARIGPMTRFFDLDEANAALPEVRTILESLRDERVELIRLRDEVLLHRSPSDAPASAPTEANVGGSSRTGDPGEGPATGGGESSGGP